MVQNDFPLDLVPQSATSRICLGEAEVRVRHLPLMLEGQVAALSAGIVRGAEAVALLDALRASSLHREDLDTYLLYPDRDLPGLLDKGVLHDEAEERVPLIRDLIESGDRSVVRAGAECLRFAPSLHSAAALSGALDALQDGPMSASVQRDRAALLEEYEAVFDHAAFTGRSGTFFGYEGLGCTFWHMTSKLILAVQETLWCAIDHGEPEEVTEHGKADAVVQLAEFGDFVVASRVLACELVAGESQYF